MSTASILVVEDDENLRLALTDNLRDEGYRVTAAATGAAACAELEAGAFDLVILDVMLPDTDGYALCERLRRDGSDARVLMLTARTLEDDLVRGLDAGADDYLKKPYKLKELLARVRALLRRHGAVAPGGAPLTSFRVEREARRVTSADGEEIALTRTELDLLLFFLDHEGRALRRDDILDAVWGREVHVDTRTVDNFVSNLKKKLGWTPESEFHIRTVRGVGYRFEVAR